MPDLVRRVEARRVGPMSGVGHRLGRGGRDFNQAVAPFEPILASLAALPRSRPCDHSRVFREFGRSRQVVLLSLAGLDNLISTAGIGENAPQTRARICAWLAWYGVELDPAAESSRDRRLRPGRHSRHRLNNPGGRRSGDREPRSLAA